MSVSTNGGDPHEVPRWPIAVLLIVLVVAALVVGNGGSGATTAPAHHADGDPAAMPAATARSSAWYCPGPPPSRSLASAREVVSVSNLEDHAVDVAVTVLRDKAPQVRRTIAVPARSTVDAAPAVAGGGAVIVEPFASRVVVESTSSGRNALASAPCATQPSSAWHFASGTTVRGVEQWIVLFNPFGDDAVVDTSFFTDGGAEQPGELQGMTVPRRSRVAIQVDQQVVRRRSVATTINARTGRIVAQETLLFGPDSRRGGETRSLGAVAPANEWVFPSGRTAAGEVRTIAISNPGDLDAEVDVTVAPAGNVVNAPVTVRVARRSVASVQIGGCGNVQPPACVPIPTNVSYSATVRATLPVPVVAEDLTTYTSGRFTGAVAGPGSRAPARTWVFARSRVPAELDAGIDLLTTAGIPARVSVSFLVKGKELKPPQLQGVVLQPGVRQTVALAGRTDLKGVDASVVVNADRPIVAERTIIRPDELTRDLGVPSRD